MNWRDKWQQWTRGGYEVVNVWEGANGLRIEILCIRGDMQKKDEIFVEPDGRAMKSCETIFDLLPITPPAEPVPQDDIAKYEAELAKCADIVQRHHPIGAVKGIGLMEVATGLEELMQDLADFRRDAERWRMRAIALVDVLRGVLDRCRHSGGYIGQDGQYQKVILAAIDEVQEFTAAVDALPDPAE